MDSRFAMYAKGSTDLESGIWYYKMENCKFKDVDGTYDGLKKDVNGDFGLPNPDCCFSYRNLWTKAYKTTTYVCTIKSSIDECLVEKDKVKAKLLGECMSKSEMTPEPKDE